MQNDIIAVLLLEHLDEVQQFKELWKIIVLAHDFDHCKLVAAKFIIEGQVVLNKFLQVVLHEEGVVLQKVYLSLIQVLLNLQLVSVDIE